MTTPVNNVSTKVALQSAADWMKQLSKKYGIKGAITEGVDRVYLGDSFGANTFGGARSTKFENLYQFVNDGFKKSKRWVIQPESTYGRSVYISSDGRFKAVTSDQYNGSGGWKVATKYIGVAIYDLEEK